MQQKDYQQLDDEIDQAKINAQDVTNHLNDAKDIANKAAQYAPQLAQKGQEYAKKGQEALNVAAGYANEAWHSGGIYYEQGENYIRDHSRTIRVVVAVLTFPIWLPFYQFLHTTLRSWEILINVIRQIKTTSKKILVFESECTVSQKAQKTLLVIFADYDIMQSPRADDEEMQSNPSNDQELQKKYSQDQQSNQFDNNFQNNMTNNNTQK
ncbi:hypothetical protein PPERSA_11740 [Pseudocohnilembus persalinus]|uniref:Uncharacterized protein n=1 Tax=Pseudocohnilembus persalinus TaxID=266149 RepID=A0A0V0QGF9_PSEPJ|nr:hypothetical protein PPERSA_11740 [Pseudocohnilembus persalinus]|eukprot:KRX01293.1 hypothetical protein PPERSA_11740 [Pseudocohnilembus persalinus]